MVKFRSGTLSNADSAICFMLDGMVISVKFLQL